jgi:hypothetical protein
MAIVIYPDSKEVLTRLVIVESDRAFFKLTSTYSAMLSTPVSGD